MGLPLKNFFEKVFFFSLKIAWILTSLTLKISFKINLLPLKEFRSFFFNFTPDKFLNFVIHPWRIPLLLNRRGRQNVKYNTTANN